MRLYSPVHFSYSRRMVSTRMLKHLNKTQLGQFNGTINDFIIGDNTNTDAKLNETLETQTRSLFVNSGTSTVDEILPIRLE